VTWFVWLFNSQGRGQARQGYRGHGDGRVGGSPRGLAFNEAKKPGIVPLIEGLISSDVNLRLPQTAKLLDPSGANGHQEGSGGRGFLAKESRATPRGANIRSGITGEIVPITTGLGSPTTGPLGGRTRVFAALTDYLLYLPIGGKLQPVTSGPWAGGPPGKNKPKRNAGSPAGTSGSSVTFRNDRWVFGARDQPGAYLGRKPAWTGTISWRQQPWSKSGASPDDHALGRILGPATPLQKVKNPRWTPTPVRLLSGRTGVGSLCGGEPG